MPLPLGFATAQTRTHRPSCLVCVARFGTAPASLAADTPENDVGADAVNAVAQVGNVVIITGVDVANTGCYTAVIAVAASGTVEPHFKLVGAILRKFEALAKEHVCDILVGAVISTVSVPRRHVEAVLHTQFARCIGEIAWNVRLFRILVRRILAVVVGCLRWPQTKAIVVLHHSDAAFHLGLFAQPQPLFGVGFARRSKRVYIFIAKSPLFTRVGIHSVVEEGVEFRLLPFHLPFRGDGKHLFRLVGRVRQRLIDEAETLRPCRQPSRQQKSEDQFDFLV